CVSCHSYAAPPVLHSFPTRRSSDLRSTCSATYDVGSTIDPPNLRLLGRIVTEPSSRTSLIVQVSPLRTQSLPLRRRRLLRRVMTVSPTPAVVPSVSATSRAGAGRAS